MAGSATFGALAALITLVAPPALQPPFPILFYLKFDAAEVVDVMAFLIFGPTAGLLTATIHGLILSTAPGGTGPFGASLKFIAVISTYLGIFLASKLGKHSLIRTSIIMTLLGIATRVLLTTIANYFYIVFLAQTIFGVNYTGFAQFVLSQSGINLTGLDFIGFILGLTAIYNVVHAIFSTVVALLIVTSLLNRAPNLLQTRAWIANLIGTIRQGSSSSSHQR